jgi:hypothetical protein
LRESDFYIRKVDVHFKADAACADFVAGMEWGREICLIFLCSLPIDRSHKVWYNLAGALRALAPVFHYTTHFTKSQAKFFVIFNKIFFPKLCILLVCPG